MACLDLARNSPVFNLRKAPPKEVKKKISVKVLEQQEEEKKEEHKEQQIINIAEKRA